MIEEPTMQTENNERPDPKEIAREVEEFVRNTPPDVLRRMRQMREERRQVQSPSNAGVSISKRLG